MENNYNFNYWLNEKPQIFKRLKSNGISITKLAKEYGISKPTFRKLLKYLGYYGHSDEEIIQIRYEDGFNFLDDPRYVNTKNYVLSKLRENLFWGYDAISGLKSIIHRDDFILGIKNSGLYTEQEFKENFDFSQIPEVFKKEEKILIRFKYYKSKITGEELWIDFETSYKYCIVSKHSLKHLKSLKKEDAEKDFILRAIDTHGINKYDFSALNLVNYKTKVEIICKQCGEHFLVNPGNFLSGRGCPSCSFISRGITKFSTKDFIKRSKVLYGDTYNYEIAKYIDKETPILLIKNSTKEIISVTPENHLKSLLDFSSFGESMIKYSLDKLGISYKREKTFVGVINGRKNNVVRIDFIIDNYKNKTFWVEYNGRQHYSYSNFYHKKKDEFKNQLKRDENIRKYCKENGIILIEIPYTYTKLSSVFETLDKIINQETDTSIIKQPKIRYD